MLGAADVVDGEVDCLEGCSLLDHSNVACARERPTPKGHLANGDG
jgi:hypothetical protein